MSQPLPYWRLSSFYLFYFACLGASLPFWGLYLRERGFGLTEIGSLMAILMATKLVAPNVWGWIADRTHKRLAIIRLGSILSALIFGLMYFDHGFVGMALVMAGFSFFWNAVMPQFEVLTLQHLGSQVTRYSRIRLWGSVGFVAAVVGLGWYFEHFPIQHLPWLVFSLYCMIAVSSFAVASPAQSPGKVQGGLRLFLLEARKPQTLLFFFVCFLMQISFGPYYTFFTIYLADFGYSKSVIGWLWALGVIAEILIFLIVHQLISHLSWRSIACGCFAITAARWWVTGAYPDNGWIIVIAQLGHAASFGVFHALAIHIVHKNFGSSTAGQGQAMYSALSFGAGGAIAAYLSGILVESWGGSMAYFLAAGVAALGGLLALALKTPAANG